MTPFILAALTCYRVSRMISQEDGPWDIFSRLRLRAALRLAPKIFDKNASYQRIEEHWIVRGLRCPLCISFWLGWLFALPLPYTGVIEYIYMALSLSAITVILIQQER